MGDSPAATHLPGHGHRVPRLWHPHRCSVDTKWAGDTQHRACPLPPEPWEPEGPAQGRGPCAARGLRGRGGGRAAGNPGGALAGSMVGSWLARGREETLCSPPHLPCSILAGECGWQHNGLRMAFWGLGRTSPAAGTPSPSEGSWTEPCPAPSHLVHPIEPSGGENRTQVSLGSRRLL